MGRVTALSTRLASPGAASLVRHQYTTLSDYNHLYKNTLINNIISLVYSKTYLIFCLNLHNTLNFALSLGLKSHANVSLISDHRAFS
jgi:hypothetical protein